MLEHNRAKKTLCETGQALHMGFCEGEGRIYCVSESCLTTSRGTARSIGS